MKKLHKPRTVHRTVAAAVALLAMAAPRRRSSPRVRGKPPHSRASRPHRPLRPQPPRPRAARMRPAPMAATPAAGRADPPNRRASRHRARMPRPSARLHPRMRPRAHALLRPSRRAAMPARPRRCPASRCATSPRHRARPAMPAKTYPQIKALSPYVGMIQIRSQVRAIQPTLSPLARAPFLY